MDFIVDFELRILLYHSTLVIISQEGGRSFTLHVMDLNSERQSWSSTTINVCDSGNPVTLT